MNTDGARIGRIRIVATQNLSGVTVFSGYISRTINAFGCHVATKDLAEALVVRVESEGAGPSRLKMEVSESWNVRFTHTSYQTHELGLRTRLAS